MTEVVGGRAPVVVGGLAPEVVSGRVLMVVCGLAPEVVGSLVPVVVGSLVPEVVSGRPPVVAGGRAPVDIDERRKLVADWSLSTFLLLVARWSGGGRVLRRKIISALVDRVIILLLMCGGLDISGDGRRVGQRLLIATGG